MEAAWTKRFNASWLASDTACKLLDQTVGALLGGHRGVPATGALFCASTASTLRDTGKQPSGAMTCTIQLALLGELLLCAEHGDILDETIVERFAGGDDDRMKTAEAIRLLRNTVCHPAAVNPNRGRLNLIALLDHVGGVSGAFKDEVWVTPTRVSMAHLADRQVTLFGLRLIDNVGYWQAEHWRVRGFPRRRDHHGARR